jgi:cyanophycinase
MNIIGKLIIIAVDKGSFTEAEIDKNNASNLHFETGILKNN